MLLLQIRKGAKVIIGMSDDGRVTGVNIGPETLQCYLNEIKTATYPQLTPNADVNEIDGKTVLVFEINEFPVKPVSYKNRYYRRVKNSNHRIIFTSPGKLYGGLKIEDLARDDYVSSIRNKLVAEAFYLMGDIEKYGTGFVRIRQQLIDYPGAGCHMSEVGDFFRVDLSKTTQKTTQKKSLREQILRLIAENPKISQRETAEVLGLSINTVKEYFTMLKKENRIKRFGGRKEGYWEVLE